jgi:hypothetical protein
MNFSVSPHDITYSKGHWDEMTLSIHPSRRPSIPSWSIYSDGAEKGWNTDAAEKGWNIDAAKEEWNTNCYNNKSNSNNRKRHSSSFAMLMVMRRAINEPHPLTCMKRTFASREDDVKGHEQWKDGEHC